MISVTIMTGTKQRPIRIAGMFMSSCRAYDTKPLQAAPAQHQIDGMQCEHSQQIVPMILWTSSLVTGLVRPT